MYEHVHHWDTVLFLLDDDKMAFGRLVKDDEAPNGGILGISNPIHFPAKGGTADTVTLCDEVEGEPEDVEYYPTLQDDDVVHVSPRDFVLAIRDCSEDVRKELARYLAADGEDEFATAVRSTFSGDCTDSKEKVTG